MSDYANVLADAYQSHTINLMRYDAGLRKQMVGILEQLRDDISGKIANIDPTSARTASVKYARQVQLLQDVNATIESAYQNASKTSGKGLFGVAQIEASFAASTVNKTLGANVMQVTLDPRTLKTLTDQTLITGATASEWWGRQSDDLKKRFADQIRMGVLAGENLGTIVQRIRGTHTGKYIKVVDAKGKEKKVPEFVGGVMQASTRNAEALVITATQAVANSARLEMYKENSDVINGVEALVTLDNRTSDICKARSGMRWKLDGTPIEPTTAAFPGPPPWHYRCRSTFIPVLKSWADLAGPNSKLSRAQINKIEAKMPPAMQSSMDGPVSADLTYEKWLKTKPVEFQKEVLGSGKWKLWNEGKIGFTDLIDQSGNPLSLDQLAALANAPKPVLTPPAAPQSPRERLLALETDPELEAARKAKDVAKAAYDAAEKEMLAAMQVVLDEHPERFFDKKLAATLGYYDTKKFPGLEELYSKVQATGNQVFTSTSRARDLAVKLKQSQKEAIQIDHSLRATAPMAVGPNVKLLGKKLQEAEEYLRSMIHQDRVPGVYVNNSPTKREYYNSGEIYVNKSTSTSVLAHEMVHDMEHRYPWILRETKAFLRMRSGGKASRPLSELVKGSNYGPKELAYEDNWKKLGTTPYAGKIYPDATELLTVGIERLMADPLDFAKRDPEYFDFLMRIFQGPKP